MCFSASASFGASALLGVTGILTLNRVKSSSQMVFASIPMFFAVQQFSEGLLWLSLTNPYFSIWESMATNLFLVFAQIVWPVWVPLSIYNLEKNRKRKQIIGVLLGLGVVLASYLAWCLMHYPVKAVNVSYHIDYLLDFPAQFVFTGNVIYFIVTVITPFLSSNKKVPLLGLLILGSYFFTIIFYTNYVISVWCFFAAIISVVVLYIITETNRLCKTHKFSYSEYY